MTQAAAQSLPKKPAQGFVPRDYQCDALRTLARGELLRLYLVWHRRAGKDKTCWVGMGDRAARGRVGNYFYVFPQQNQARRSLWTNLDGQGFRTIDHLPAQLVKRRREDEMFIELNGTGYVSGAAWQGRATGSTIQVLGADKPGAIATLRGGNPVGLVLSEWAYMNPRVWDTLRPVLAENGGWIVFNTTPNGPNHAKAMWDEARADDRWFTQLLTVDDTGAIPPAMLAAERREIAAIRGEQAADAELMREYYCSWDVWVEGAYYALQMTQAEREGRIGWVPWDPDVPVDTWWDIGIGKDDATAVWFVQRLPGGLHVIDYEEWNQQGLPEVIKSLKQKPYVWRRFEVPHDMEHREFGAGAGAGTRLDRARRLMPEADWHRQPGSRKISLEDGIDAVRALLPRCRFDAERCKLGLDALRSYHKEYDEVRRVYREHPFHDWSSHGADAFRTGAVVQPRTAPRQAGDEPASRGGHSAGWMG